MRPDRADIAAPELAGRLRWHNSERRPRIAELVAGGPLLVHFFDFAQVNSVRALPYILTWAQRYGDVGLTVLGVHSPRFAFSADPQALGPALRRLGIGHPVVDDSGFSLWRDYGCRGWPSLFIWGKGGALRWYHEGEGEYEATEEAIQEELLALDPSAPLPPPLEPLRPSDASDALVVPPSPEVLPGGSTSAPWSASVGEEALRLTYAAGGAHVSAAGAGELRASIDDEMRPIEIVAPGLYDLAEHPRHSEHALELRADPGVELYSVSFSAGLP